MPAVQPIKTVLTIPTFQRDEMLLALLKQLNSVLQHRHDVALIVVNNAVNSRLKKPSYRLPLKLITEQKRGLACVRNRMLHEALKHYPHARYIAMLDDDSLLQHDWLSELENIADATDAHLTGGLQTLLPGEYSRRVKNSVLANRQNKPSGLTSILYGTHNLLIRSSFLVNMPKPFFDEGFNFSGGEDTDFFIRAQKHGAVFAWSADATVYERADSQRLSTLALLVRHYGMGHAYARVVRKHFPWRQRLLWLVGFWFKAITQKGRLLNIADALGYSLGLARIYTGRFYG